LLGVKGNGRATFEKLTDSAKSPHIVLCNSLIGCKEQCPFCKEQCELTDENHENLTIQKSIVPRCLGKYKHIDDNKLVLKTCINSVDPETDRSFKNVNTKDEYLLTRITRRFTQIG